MWHGVAFLVSAHTLHDSLVGMEQRRHACREGDFYFGPINPGFGGIDLLYKLSKDVRPILTKDLKCRVLHIATVARTFC